MVKNDKGGRPQGEERHDRARKTNDEAWALIDLEREAIRKKTARLRALRLAKETTAAAAVEKPVKKARSLSRKKPK